MRILGVIPARFKSTRLEGKPLLDICGKPMIQHVYERARSASSLADVLVATDDARIARAVESFGGRVVMTSAAHATGSDRVAEAVASLAADIVVNIQGDEPLIDPVLINECIQPLKLDPFAKVGTVARRILAETSYHDPAVVKVVWNLAGKALYFSRSLIPCPRTSSLNIKVYEHIGVYAYTKDCLLKFTQLLPSPLEVVEGLEQLRLLENEIPINVAETCCTCPYLSVDTPQDLAKARHIMATDLERGVGVQPDHKFIENLRASLPASQRERLDLAVRKIAAAKQKGGRVVVVTGSGPNLHEGVTTLVAELIHKGVVDGVITSSAIVAHEMAGVLDRVKRVKAGDQNDLGLNEHLLPRGRIFEITCLPASQREALQGEMPEGWDLYERIQQMPGDTIIKAAGNMAWPMGLRTERLASEAEDLAKQHGATVEQIVGLGADRRTMIGAAAERKVPIVVSVPQLIGGGSVGLAIGDAICLSRRCRLVADLLAGAEVIIESAIALSQEIHDGPFETYTGHGIWAAWRETPVYTLEGKTLIRIDLDPNLELAWREERDHAEVQRAVDRGLPKTKVTGIPFRMEMSGFARLEGSIPLSADIGVAWPLMASALEIALQIQLDFISAPQETTEGQRMREWIASEIQALDRHKMLDAAKRLGPPVPSTGGGVSSHKVHAAIS